jgi:hypothetical protein
MQKFYQGRFVVESPRNMLKVHNVDVLLRVKILIDGEHGVIIEYLDVFLWI